MFLDYLALAILIMGLTLVFYTLFTSTICRTRSRNTANTRTRNRSTWRAG